MQIVIELSDSLIKKVKEHYVNPYEVDEICEAILDGIQLPENATNGDMIKALFQNTTVIKNETIVNVIKLDVVTMFSKYWWDAPYKRGES